MVELVVVLVLVVVVGKVVVVVEVVVVVVEVVLVTVLVVTEVVVVSVVVKVGHTQVVVFVVLVEVVRRVVVVVVVVGTNTRLHGCCKLAATVSTQVPSRFDRWILSEQLSAKYSLLEILSTAIPVGASRPSLSLVMMSSVCPLDML